MYVKLPEHGLAWYTVPRAHRGLTVKGSPREALPKTRHASWSIEFPELYGAKLTHLLGGSLPQFANERVSVGPLKPSFQSNLRGQRPTRRTLRGGTPGSIRPAPRKKAPLGS